MRAWKIGSIYTITENGRHIRGKIIAIVPAGYVVKWNDGETTTENKPDPQQ